MNRVIFNHLSERVNFKTVSGAKANLGGRRDGLGSGDRQPHSKRKQMMSATLSQVPLDKGHPGDAPYAMVMCAQNSLNESDIGVEK